MAFEMTARPSVRNLDQGFATLDRLRDWAFEHVADGGAVSYRFGWGWGWLLTVVAGPRFECERCGDRATPRYGITRIRRALRRLADDGGTVTIPRSFDGPITITRAADAG